MASLFAPRPYQNRPRAVSNGGLGGFVRPDIARHEVSEYGTWPKRGRRRPPPLEISYDNDNLLVPAPPWSAISIQSSKGTWSPNTPGSYGSDTGHVTTIRSQESTPLISRFNSATQLSNSRPVTPGYANLPSKIPPAELAGSLLLPSQGFAPPPATPPRLPNIRRRNTDDSDLDSVPSLTTTSSLDSSSSDMDRLKGLSTHHWKGSTSNAVIAKTAHKTSTVSKPFSAMSIEEVLVSLPKDPATVARVWLPEMQKKCSEMRQLLQKAQDSTYSEADVTKLENVSTANSVFNSVSDHSRTS